MSQSAGVVEEQIKMDSDAIIINKLIKRRTNIKGRLTRVYNFILNDSEVSDKYLLQVKYNDLIELYNKYDELQSEIESIDSDEDRQQIHELERQNVEDKYFTNKAKLLKLLNDIDRKQSIMPGIQDLSFSAFAGGLNSQVSQVQPKVMLPKLQIPTFDGTIKDWTNFKSLFTSVIDSNTQLSNLQKLQYLKTLLRGEAAGIVSSLVLSDDNYKKAMQSLDNRYDNKLININYYLNNICSHSPITKFNLKAFLTLLQQSLDSLTSLKVPVIHWDLILIYIIVNKLDNYLRTAWEVNRNSTELPTLKELIEFLNHRSTALELINEKPNYSNHSKLNRVVSHVNIVSNNCAMCNKSHELIKCPSFLEMNPQQRNNFVKSKRLCFNCLRPYSFHHKCSNSTCSICHKKHHTMIHIAKSVINRPLSNTHERSVSGVQTYNHNSVTPQQSNSLQAQQATSEAQVLLGPLPNGFLRTDGEPDTLDADYQAALALQQQLCGATVPPAGPPLTARLSITIAQAKLVKNYGLTRMDPYMRVRVGHCIYETHTDTSGGKTPRWNKVIHCLLPPGVNSFYLEIFDECSFTMDELIAWAHISIPQAVLNGETHEDWYPLTGKQGEGLEGMINLVLSYSVGPAAMPAFQPMLVVPSTGLGYATMPVYPSPVQYQQQYPQTYPPQQETRQQPPVTAEQLQQIQEMFPSIEKDVIKSVLEANNGNKDATINSLLQMSE